MGAKRKLNVAHVTGAVVVAALLGAMGGSWVVFLLSFAVLVGLDVAAGNVRR